MSNLQNEIIYENLAEKFDHLCENNAEFRDLVGMCMTAQQQWKAKEFGREHEQQWEVFEMFWQDMGEEFSCDMRGTMESYLINRGKL